ncbi:MAG TPA: hypothetical protein VFJ90_06370 [Candidatus Didemnitutus sp.]|nr:hypothetical protein [Candidatus Didemnitutus sp.]
MRLRIFVLLALIGVRTLCGQEAIPAGELVRPPSPERIAALVDSAAQKGWGTWVPPLRRAMFAAYERDPAGAAPWYILYRWSTLLGTPKAKAVQNWIKAIEDAGVGHSNMANRYDLPPGSLSSLVSPELQRYLLGTPAFSQEFFDTFSDVDQPIEVLSILQQLYAASPTQFAEYPSLALAIAVVFDVPPPPDWPHGQVSAQLLPRKFPKPVDAFNYWVRLDRANITLLGLKRLPASELKYVIDTVTPFAELTWAQKNAAPSLAELDQTYTAIKYRQDRVTGKAFTWPGTDYKMDTILRTGGICVDQAYYATNAGKARGVPTLFFRGAGLDGRHAWFGYLSASGWKLDVGRYAEQKFVAGVAYDPQTWRILNDHELAFLTDRFRALPLYQLSAVHAAVAKEYLHTGDGDTAAALKAAREAVNRERRNLEAWQVLLQAQRRAKLDPRTIEGTLREAALAFQRYPDLEVGFSRQLVESLRARGELSVAAVEDQRIVQKYQSGRSDLSIKQAAEMLQRSIEQDDIATQIKTYQKILTTYGFGAGMDFFDKVVLPFAAHLKQKGQVPAALQALDRARQTLRVEKGSQLDQELAMAAEKLRKG